MLTSRLPPVGRRSGKGMAELRCMLGNLPWRPKSPELRETTAAPVTVPPYIQVFAPRSHSDLDTERRGRASNWKPTRRKLLLIMLCPPLMIILTNRPPTGCLTVYSTVCQWWVSIVEQQSETSLRVINELQTNNLQNSWSEWIPTGEGNMDKILLHGINTLIYSVIFSAKSIKQYWWNNQISRYFITVVNPNLVWF